MNTRTIRVLHSGLNIGAAPAVVVQATAQRPESEVKATSKFKKEEAITIWKNV